jgi:hypothetical protein
MKCIKVKIKIVAKWGWVVTNLFIPVEYAVKDVVVRNNFVTG